MKLELCEGREDVGGIKERKSVIGIYYMKNYLQLKN